MGIFMTLFSLGARLALCASMVRPGTALADIGTDHAHLPIWLAKQGLISKAVASDVRPGPLERAKQNIETYDAVNEVKTRLCDGLDGILPEEADDVVIAGMGGEMISEIVSRAVWLKNAEKHLILQPMTREENLRRSLLKMGFTILREQAVLEEGHVYTVMLCAYSPGEGRKIGLFPYIGLLDAKTPESRAYLCREQKRLSDHANGFTARGDGEKASELLQLRAQIGEMLAAEKSKSEE